MILAASMGPTPKIPVRVVPEASTSASMRPFRSAIFRCSVRMSRRISEAKCRRRRAEAPWGRMPRTMRAARWAENVPATPPGTRSRRSPCRRLFQWMDILIVPVAVGIGLYLLEQSQRRREENEQRRREEERERAAALQEYLNQMSEDLKTQRLIRAELK